jgi:hypothetical protein
MPLIHKNMTTDFTGLELQTFQFDFVIVPTVWYFLFIFAFYWSYTISFTIDHFDKITDDSVTRGNHRLSALICKMHRLFSYKSITWYRVAVWQ